MKLQQLLEIMWEDYCQLNPAALRIFNLLEAEGEKVLNDHIALRTFRHPKVGISKMAYVFEKFGYKKMNEYFFKEKKLFAQHYEHTDEKLPKIFISELELDKLSSGLRNKLEQLINQIPESFVESDSFTVCGRHWEISSGEYEQMYKESEYAAWVSAFGFRPNHFTVNVNALQKLDSIEKINQFLLKNGFTLNTSGGAIKGTAADMLEQSSIMAVEIDVDFSDRRHRIPGCYYEFAKRYTQPKTGKLYQGFIAASADKIFESTNRAR
ncbi:MAG: DUF1338 domain-containing protein [Bdellovibrio sp.]